MNPVEAELNITKGEKMSEALEPIEEDVYVICVVALVREALPKRVYDNFYLGVQGSREDAVVMQNTISKVGFKTGDHRVFPDDIESINLKKKDDVNGEKETNQA